MWAEPVPYHELLETDAANLIASFSMCIAQLMNFHLGYQHYRRNTRTQERHRILNILAIVPMYGINWIQLAKSNHSTVEHVLYEYIRQFYGAHTMYNFLVLCYEYLGGEENIMRVLSRRPVAASWTNRTGSYTDRFHRFCKYAVLQFWTTKALSVLRVGILQWWFNYRESDWGNIGYICITVDSIISAAFALYALTLFIGVVRTYIKPDPTLKFVVVTVLVYLTYWQGVVLAILENLGLMASATDASGLPVLGRASMKCQNFLVVVELLVAAIALRIAFPVPDDQPTPSAIAAMEEVSANSQTKGIRRSKHSPRDRTSALNRP